MSISIGSACREKELRSADGDHGISTGDPLRSAPRPHNPVAHSLGRPEWPLRAPSKSGKQKKIEFPHPTSYMYEPRGYVYEGRFFSCYSWKRRPSARGLARTRASPRPCAPARPNSARGVLCGRISTRSAHKTEPVPRAVSAHSAVAAPPLTPKGRA